MAALLSAAIAISYLDRQALSVAVAAIQHDIPLTNPVRREFSRPGVSSDPDHDPRGAATVNW
jgi:hypothetical protein